MAFKARTVALANGVQTAFAVSFPLSPIQGRNGVHVYVHAVGAPEPGTPLVSGTDYTWVSDGQISFTHAPAGGQQVDIRRATQDTALDNVLPASGSLRADQIVQNDTQLLYLNQEREDDIADHQTQIEAETAARIAADAVLQTNINTNSNAIVASNNSIAAEAAARGTADAAIIQTIITQQNGGILPTDQVIITPESFGAVRYDPLNEVDASVGLQAFFDAFISDAFARKYIGDWHGEWMVTRTIKAAYGGGGTLNVERRFRMGSLRVPTLDRLPGNLPLDPVLDIAGSRQTWAGVCGIHTAGLSLNDPVQRSYNGRASQNGVRLRSVATSTFGDFALSCVRRDGLRLSSNQNAGFTLNGIVFPNAQNEACVIGRVDGEFVGSSDRGTEATPLVPSVRTQGSTSSGTGTTYTNAEVFVAGISGFGGSFAQRTQFTVPSTADLAVFDVVKSRLELTPAIYGTIAADNATKTFIWGAGNPTDIDGLGNGLQVGDIYPAFFNGGNANRIFRIVGFGGTSNRTITVTNMVDGSGPVTMAATADPSFAQDSEWTHHIVTCVKDATHFSVVPWVPSRHNSSIHIIHGAVLATDGGDLANSYIRAVQSLDCGILADITGLFLPRIGTLLGQSCSVGLKIGNTPDDAAIGLVVEHAHIGTGDDCDVPILALTAANSASVTALSSFTLSACLGFNARALPNDQVYGPASLGVALSLNFGGYLLEAQSGSFGSNPPTAIDNSKPNRQQLVMANTADIVVNFALDEFRTFVGHRWAEITWVGADGSAPSGSLTLDMHPALIALGWAFTGAIVGTTGNFSAVTKSQHVKLLYIPDLKKIAVARFSGV